MRSTVRRRATRPVFAECTASRHDTRRRTRQPSVVVRSRPEHLDRHLDGRRHGRLVVDDAQASVFAWLRNETVHVPGWQVESKPSQGGPLVARRYAPGVHACATKGLTGHTMGAAGLLEAGRASLLIGQSAWREEPGPRALLCEGRIRIGWVDATTLKPARIPASILERLS